MVFCAVCAVFGLWQLADNARLRFEVEQLHGSWLAQNEQIRAMAVAGIEQGGALAHCGLQVDHWQSVAATQGARFLICDNERRDMRVRLTRKASTRYGDAPIVLGEIR
jgi:hypothetical protein